MPHLIQRYQLEKRTKTPPSLVTRPGTAPTSNNSNNSNNSNTKDEALSSHGAHSMTPTHTTTSPQTGNSHTSTANLNQINSIHANTNTYTSNNDDAASSSDNDVSSLLSFAKKAALETQENKNIICLNNSNMTTTTATTATPSHHTVVSRGSLGHTPTTSITPGTAGSVPVLPTPTPTRRRNAYGTVLLCSTDFSTSAVGGVNNKTGTNTITPDNASTTLANNPSNHISGDTNILTMSSSKVGNHDNETKTTKVQKPQPKSFHFQDTSTTLGTTTTTTTTKLEPGGMSNNRNNTTGTANLITPKEEQTVKDDNRTNDDLTTQKINHQQQQNFNLQMQTPMRYPPSSSSSSYTQQQPYPDWYSFHSSDPYNTMRTLPPPPPHAYPPSFPPHTPYHGHPHAHPQHPFYSGGAGGLPGPGPGHYYPPCPPFFPSQPQQLHGSTIPTNKNTNIFITKQQQQQQQQHEKGKENQNPTEKETPSSSTSSTNHKMSSPADTSAIDTTSATVKKRPIDGVSDITDGKDESKRIKLDATTTVSKADDHTNENKSSQNNKGENVYTDQQLQLRAQYSPYPSQIPSSSLSSSVNNNNNNNNNNENKNNACTAQAIHLHHPSMYPMNDPRAAAAVAAAGHYASFPPPYLMHMYRYPPNGHMMSPMRPQQQQNQQQQIGNTGGGSTGSGSMTSGPDKNKGSGYNFPNQYQDLRMMGNLSSSIVGSAGNGGTVQQGMSSQQQHSMHPPSRQADGKSSGDFSRRILGPLGHEGSGSSMSGNDSSLGGYAPPKGQNVQRCERILPPITLKVWSDDEMKNTEIPDFPHLVNFPAHLHRYRTLSEVEKDRRRCVMCGETRLCSTTGSNQSRETFSRSKQKMAHYRGLPSDESNEAIHIIPKQNKGLCTACDVAVWVIKESGVEIKWCKGCKNFRPWAAFGDKGLATKCLRCRERQREKYANQKEEKSKKQTASKHGNKKDEERQKISPKRAAKKNSSINAESLSSPQNHGMSCLIAATTKVTNEEKGM